MQCPRGAKGQKEVSGAVLCPESHQDGQEAVRSFCITKNFFYGYQNSYEKDNGSRETSGSSPSTEEYFTSNFVPLKSPGRSC